MAGLLDTLNPNDPASLALLTADSEPVTLAPQTMADTGPSFLSRVGSGFSDVVGGLGQALGGGLSDEVTGSERAIAGPRALLNFGLTMLANSGPSYTPRNFGQILASGLAAAGETNQLAELNAFRRDQSKQTLALRKQQADMAALTHGLAVLKYRRDLKLGADTDADIDRTLGGGGTGQPTPGGSGTVPPQGEPPADTKAFVDQFRPFAEAAGQATGFDPTFVLAQAAHESDSGRSRLAREQNNFFGIKNSDGTYAKYASPQEGFAAYAGLLQSPRYAGVPRTGSPEAIGEGLRAAGYAEDRNYGAGIARRYEQIAGLQAPAAPGRAQFAGPGAGGGPPTPPAPGAAAPAAAPGGATQTEAETGLPMVSKPAAPPAAAPGATAAGTPRLTDKVIVPKPDNGDLAAQRAEADQTFRAELAAARRIPDAQPKAAAVAAARDKLQTRLTAITDEVNKRNADWQIRQGAAENEQRIREEQRAQKVADDEKQRAQKVADDEAHRQFELKKAADAAQATRDLEAQKARDAANLSWKTAAVKNDADRLQKLTDSGDAATRVIRDTVPLQQLAASMGPASALGETDTGKKIRDWMVAMNIGGADKLTGLKDQQMWDRMIGGLFDATHVTGLGNQTDREGGWLMRSWGGVGQTPLDRQTQLWIIRKLAEERVKDAQDARELFQDPTKQSLLGLGERQKQRASVFDRPPADEAVGQPGSPEWLSAQTAYNASHAVGEPYFSWVEIGKGSGNWRQAWSRNTGDPKKPIDYHTVGAGR